MKQQRVRIIFALGLTGVFCVYRIADANPQFFSSLHFFHELPRPKSVFSSPAADSGIGRSVSDFEETGDFSKRFGDIITSGLEHMSYRHQPAPGNQTPGLARPFPRQEALRIVTAIENKFDKEKYEAFKIFSEEKTPQGELKTEKNKILFIQKGLGAYQEALMRAARKAEAARLHLVRYLTDTLGGNSVMPQDVPYLRMVISSFLAAASPGIGPFVLDWALNSASAQMEYRRSLENLEKTRLFLERNVTDGGMPLSYQTTTGFWRGLRCPMNAVDSVLERVLVRYSVNIYDSAVWKIALTVFGSKDSSSLVDAYTQRMISGTSGRLLDIRAWGPRFKYGEKKKVFKNRDGGFFFRIIADEYIQEDPLGENEVDGFPNFKTVHHEDWKPIAGEQAWAAIIGPLQVAYQKYGADIPAASPEMRLAMSMLPAIRAMQSSVGAIYHAPEGTHGKNPRDISNENNFSMYSALRMLHRALEGKDRYNDEIILGLLQKQLSYFKNYAFDRQNNIFYQGGFYVDGAFIPTKIFAVDCQTWGIASLGVEKIDDMFGEGACYHIWKNTVRRAGYFDERGVLLGVGFTDDHRILSVEWTCGAILAARKMAKAYEITHPQWARECARDAITMRNGIESAKNELPDGSYAYLYANNRYFIPFGWWANPIPSLVSSAWVILIDLCYDPFELGGGPYFKRVK